MRLLAVLSSFFVAIAAAAQDVRDLSDPIAQTVLLDVPASSVAAQIGLGYRPINLEFRSNGSAGPQFDVTFVQNSGSYAAGYWYYIGITAAQVSSNLAANNARLIDLESYVDASSTQRFACIMVDNTGVHAKAWWWYYNTSTAAISTAVTANNGRIVDLDSYSVGASTYYSAIMISNTGADARSWWWYLGQSSSQVSAQLSANQARLYDLEVNPAGTLDVVMVRGPGSPAWYWWIGLQAGDLAGYLGNYGVRPIDLESYVVGGTRYYAMVAINNSNALTTLTGQAMRSATDGTVGCWLKEIGGDTYAQLNSMQFFEPASCMKVVHHTHAMKQVQQGVLSLSDLIQVYAAYNASNTSCPLDQNPFQESLQMALQFMMRNSDNARTQAIAARFGVPNILATASVVGMTNTQINHRLGCNAGLTSPNRTTLRDLDALHTAVAGGYLGSYRDTFYNVMLSSLNDLSVNSIIDNEGAALGLTAIQRDAFRSTTRLAHKGGSYDFNTSTGLIIHRAEFGWLKLPYISANRTVYWREFTLGAFVNNGSVGANADAAIWTQALPTMLTPTIREALQTWVNSAYPPIQSPYGAGCGAGPLTWTCQVLPQLGTTARYLANNLTPNTLAVAALGFSNSAWNGTPLPFPLASFGGQAGCMMYVSADSLISTFALGTQIGLNLAIPADPFLLGLYFYSQAFSLDPLGILSTNANASRIGF